MGGDVVRARVVEFRGKKEIRIERVLKRAKQEIVGKMGEKECLLEPLDENVHLSFLLSGRDCSRLEEGTVVVARITVFPGQKAPARVKVKEVLGHPERKFLAIDLLIRKHNLPTEYPAEVLEEVAEIPDRIPEEEIRKRRDLREQVCLGTTGSSFI